MEIFSTIFEKLNNGQRFGNPAMHLQSIAQQPEAADWDRTTAVRFSTYSSNRVRGGMSHDAALVSAIALVN